jgi:hypothetical protein
MVATLIRDQQAATDATVAQCQTRGTIGTCDRAAPGPRTTGDAVVEIIRKRDLRRQHGRVDLREYGKASYCSSKMSRASSLIA